MELANAAREWLQYASGVVIAVSAVVTLYRLARKAANSL